MDKDSTIELTELKSNLFNPISNSKENLIEVSKFTITFSM